MELQDYITKKAKKVKFKKFEDLNTWFDKTIDHTNHHYGEYNFDH